MPDSFSIIVLMFPSTPLPLFEGPRTRWSISTTAKPPILLWAWSARTRSSSWNVSTALSLFLCLYSNKIAFRWERNITRAMRERYKDDATTWIWKYMYDIDWLQWVDEWASANRGRVCVCLCISVCVCLCICMCLLMYMHVCLLMYMHVCLLMYIRVCLLMYILVCLLMCIHVVSPSSLSVSTEFARRFAEHNCWYHGPRID